MAMQNIVKIMHPVWKWWPLLPPCCKFLLATKGHSFECTVACTHFISRTAVLRTVQSASSASKSSTTVCRCFPLPRITRKASWKSLTSQHTRHTSTIVRTNPVNIPKAIGFPSFKPWPDWTTVSSNAKDHYTSMSWLHLTVKQISKCWK